MSRTGMMVLLLFGVGGLLCDASGQVLRPVQATGGTHPSFLGAESQAASTAAQRLRPSRGFVALLSVTGRDDGSIEASSERLISAPQVRDQEGVPYMVAGGILFVAGAIAGGDGGMLLVLGGAGVGAYGAYVYFGGS